MELMSSKDLLVRGKRGSESEKETCWPASRSQRERERFEKITQLTLKITGLAGVRDCRGPLKIGKGKGN